MGTGVSSVFIEASALDPLLAWRFTGPSQSNPRRVDGAQDL